MQYPGCSEPKRGTATALFFHMAIPLMSHPVPALAARSRSLETMCMSKLLHSASQWLYVIVLPSESLSGWQVHKPWPLTPAPHCLLVTVQPTLQLLYLQPTLHFWSGLPQPVLHTDTYRWLQFGSSLLAQRHPANDDPDWVVVVVWVPDVYTVRRVGSSHTLPGQFVRWPPGFSSSYWGSKHQSVHAAPLFAPC